MTHLIRPLAVAVLAGATITACSSANGAHDTTGTSSRGTGGMTAIPGNGCAAGLGIDAGFYTCSNEYFVSTTGSDANSGASAAQYTILTQQQVLPLLNAITAEPAGSTAEGQSSNKEYAGS